MENEFNALKTFITTTLSPYIEEAVTQDTPMNTVGAKNVVFGSVDVSRNTGKVIVSVLPEEQEEADEQYINKRTYLSRFTVTFICSGYSYDVLMRQVARYSSAFCYALLRNQDLGNNIKLEDLGERRFFTDAGTTEKQMTAFEVDVTLSSEVKR